MHYQTASEQLAALRAARISSVELVAATIARIEARDGALNAIVVRDFERARQSARAADAARARGEEAPLLGLPVTVKEAFNVAGLPTTWGRPGTAAAAVTEDAVLVSRLRRAGAIVLGKSNVSTGLVDWQAANPVYGVTANPWDPARTPGGSSGGGAAALAAGLVPLEFGSDLGGSLRIPASFCGILSHRPSYGLVPLRGMAPPGVPQAAPVPAIDQAVAGPMARSAGDLMLALDVIAGPDLPEAAAWRLALPPARHAALAEFRVLVIDETPAVPTAGAIRQALATLAGRLEAAGCRVARQSPLLPDLGALGRVFTELLLAFFGADMPEAGFAAAVAGAAAVAAERDDAEALRHRALVMRHRDWILADRRRFALAERWRRLFEAFDVVLCPAAPVTAFAHDTQPFEQRQLQIDGAAVPYMLLPMWAALPTPTGQPVTTMPMGHDAPGLPIGVQIIGPYLEDRTPIAFAGLVEAALGGFVRSPFD